METVKRAARAHRMRPLMAFDRKVFRESDRFSKEYWQALEAYWMLVDDVKVGNSKATEVLFLKYMLESLRSGGRCGVIVPEATKAFPVIVPPARLARLELPLPLRRTPLVMLPELVTLFPPAVWR